VENSNKSFRQLKIENKIFTYRPQIWVVIMEFVCVCHFTKSSNSNASAALRDLSEEKK
jgi:hypothetical protein